MTSCLDTDTLVGVGAAIGWETEDTLHHIATCHESHEELRRLAKLHGVLNDQMQPMPGFTERVLGGLRASDRTPPVAPPLVVRRSVQRASCRDDGGLCHRPRIRRVGTRVVWAAGTRGGGGCGHRHGVVEPLAWRPAYGVVTVHRSPVTGHRSPVTGYRSPVT